MKRIAPILLILSLFIHTNFAAQQSNANISNENVNFKNLLGRSGYTRPLETDGSPYIYTEYKKAKIGNSSQLYDMRYNAYKDEIEILNNGKVMTIFKNPSYSPIHLLDSNETIYLKDYTYKGKAINGYLFEIKKAKDFSILMRISKTFDKGKVADSSFDRDIADSYTDLLDVFFIQKEGAEVLEIPDTKKKLIELFPDRKEQIEKNIKTNKINTKDASVLSQVISAFS